VAIDENDLPAATPDGGFRVSLDLPLLSVPAPLDVSSLLTPTRGLRDGSTTGNTALVTTGEHTVGAALDPIDSASIAAAVQAELDRLAFLPDREDEQGPVVLPTITPAELHVISPVPDAPAPTLPEPPVVERLPEAPAADAPAVQVVEAPVEVPAAVVAEPAAPAASAVAAQAVTSQPVTAQPVAPQPVAPQASATPQAQPSFTPVLQQGQAFAPKASAAPVRHAYADLVAAAAPSAAPRRKKRRVFRKLFSFLVFLGMVGGGLFAVKHFVLDRVKWAADIAPLAQQVEATRGLSFDHDVPVVVLPADDYALKVASDAVGLTGEAQSRTAATWRAFGVASGVLDRRAVGLAAMAELPVFYDPVDDSIYEVEGLDPALREFQMHRALAMALLDQEFGWWQRIATASKSVQVGTRGLYDADALRVAASLLDTEQRSAVNAAVFGMYGDYAIPASPAPYATAAAARPGLALRPYLESLADREVDGVLDGAVIDDGRLLDLRRLLNPAASPADSSQGMLFWYHALASRIDDDLAWNAALAWLGDDVVFEPQAGATCAVATLQVSPPAAPLVQTAFDQWAAAAPAASATTVTQVQGASGVVQLSVRACDPGEQVPTNDGSFRLSLGASPLRSEQFRLLRATQPTLDASTAACAVYVNDPVTMADERGLVDPAEGWAAPAAHAVPSRGSC
jgi:hypothetical protein